MDLNLCVTTVNNNSKILKNARIEHKTITMKYTIFTALLILTSCSIQKGIEVTKGQITINADRSDFSNFKFSKSTFKYGNYDHCNFNGAEFNDCVFEEADLNNADFRNAKLVNVDFKGSDLRGVRFNKKTDLRSTRFFKCKVGERFIDKLKECQGGNQIYEYYSIGDKLKDAKGNEYYLLKRN